MGDPPLNPRQRAAALALAAGRTRRAAARAARCSERTVGRWTQNPEFMGEVRRLRDDLIGRAAGRLSRAAARASESLDKLLEDPDPRVRLRAAIAILDMMIRVRDHHDLAARLAELERRLDLAGDSAEVQEGPAL